ncbi:hypothetical protein [Shewanella algicola]|uniref:hypothetical protein n=1 Tax=Shewanella algicola TaxID=640633 RepID=UPI002495701A|nr:hypothetical protein [Shewanella algicola]
MAVPPTNITTTTTTPSPATPKVANASQQVSPDIQQKQATVASTATPKATSDLAAVLLPVKLQQPQTTVSTDLDITIQNQQYQLTKTAELQKLLQQTAQVVITSEQAKAVTKAANLALTQGTNTAQPTNMPQQFAPAVTVNQPAVSVISTQLVLLAQTINLTLPTSLTELAQQNGVSTQQLSSLASRPQGYTLPTAQISQGLLTFTDGPSIKLPHTIALSEGQYLAKVVVNQQQLQLALTPVVAKVNVDLVKQAAAMPDLQSNNVVLTKNEPAQILSQFLKKLEATPLPSTNNPKTPVNQSGINQNTINQNSINQSKPATGSTSTNDVVNSAQQASRNIASSGANSTSNIVNGLGSRPEIGLSIGNGNTGVSAAKEIPVNLSTTVVTSTSTGIKTNSGNEQQSSQQTSAIKPQGRQGGQHLTPTDIGHHTQKVSGQQLTTSYTSSSISSTTMPVAQNPQTISTAQATQTTSNAQVPQVPQATQSIPPVANIAVTNDAAQSTQTVNKDPQPIEVLNKALSKAGAMPIKQQQNLQLPNSLATELLKHLPQMSPHPLSALSDPHLLSHELHSLASLNLAQSILPSNSASSPVYSGGAITTLFQLLLGVKAQSNSSGLSAKLQDHLAQLQQRTLAKLTGNSGLLGALDKLGGADSMAQLANSIAMYQQASTDQNQAMTWYFALPYSINQRDEQFEGKFEHDSEQDQEKGGWKLQLKFNLAQGSLLICAHKKADKLDIQFKGNSQSLLERVDKFNGALATKISQIGLTPGTFSSQLTHIPATLLPGDHYLVKTRA